MRRGRPVDGATPLFAAAAGGYASVVAHLLSLGADPHQVCGHCCCSHLKRRVLMSQMHNQEQGGVHV